MSYLENSLNFSNSINVLESEIPAKYRHEVYDICLISAVEDAVERNKFAQILKKFIRLSDKSEPKIVSVDERGSDDSAYNDRILDTVKDAFENSSYIFYYLTPNYQKWNKGELFKDEGLINSFRTNKNCIVPVFAVTKQGQKNKVPYGLRSYKGIDLHTLLKRRNLKEINVDELKRENVDCICLENIAKMLNECLEERNKKQIQKKLLKEEWKIKELNRRQMQCSTAESAIPSINNDCDMLNQTRQTAVQQNDPLCADFFSFENESISSVSEINDCVSIQLPYTYDFNNLFSPYIPAQNALLQQNNSQAINYTIPNNSVLMRGLPTGLPPGDNNFDYMASNQGLLPINSGNEFGYLVWNQDMHASEILDRNENIYGGYSAVNIQENNSLGEEYYPVKINIEQNCQQRLIEVQQNVNQRNDICTEQEQQVFKPVAVVSPLQQQQPTMFSHVHSSADTLAKQPYNQANEAFVQQPHSQDVRAIRNNNIDCETQMKHSRNSLNTQQSRNSCENETIAKSFTRSENHADDSNETVFNLKRNAVESCLKNHLVQPHEKIENSFQSLRSNFSSQENQYLDASSSIITNESEGTMVVMNGINSREQDLHGASAPQILLENSNNSMVDDLEFVPIVSNKPLCSTSEMDLREVEIEPLQETNFISSSSNDSGLGHSLNNNSSSFLLSLSSQPGNSCDDLVQCSIAEERNEIIGKATELSLSSNDSGLGQSLNSDASPSFLSSISRQPDDYDNDSSSQANVISMSHAIERDFAPRRCEIIEQVSGQPAKEESFSNYEEHMLLSYESNNNKKQSVSNITASNVLLLPFENVGFNSAPPRIQTVPSVDVYNSALKDANSNSFPSQILLEPLLNNSVSACNVLPNAALSTRCNSTPVNCRLVKSLASDVSQHGVFKSESQSALDSFSNNSKKNNKPINKQSSIKPDKKPSNDSCCLQ